MSDLQLEYSSSSQTSLGFTEKSIFYYGSKRVIDVVGASVGMLLCSPIVLFTALAIKIEDPMGSILFKQTRVGHNGKEFTMYKFRSMVQNAEEMVEDLQHQNEMSGPVFKMKEDPRITRVGRFLRKSSIDEVPQFFNVFKGEMSLVGPRPALPREVEEYDEYHRARLLAKPGLTCFWQVSGRSNIDFEQWMELDVKYVRERSVWTDIKLILKTIKVFVYYEGAH